MTRRQYIKEWRRHRGMTQAEVAKSMGISVSYFTMIEGGSRRYDQNFLEGAALVLETTPADLIARPPGAAQRIDSLLGAVSEEERMRIEAAIRALINPRSGE